MGNEASEVILAGSGGSGVTAGAVWSSDAAIDVRAGVNSAERLRAAQMPQLSHLSQLAQLSPDLRLISLAEAPVGRWVHLVHQGVNGLLGHRLVDLGFTAGARMRVVRKGPAGNLIAVSIRNTVIALRSSEAKSIIVSESGG